MRDDYISGRVVGGLVLLIAGWAIYGLVKLIQWIF